MANEPVPVGVAGVEDLDARLDVFGLRTVRAAVPKDVPHLFGRRVQLEGEFVSLHGPARYPARGVYAAASCCTDAASESSQRQLWS